MPRYENSETFQFFELLAVNWDIRTLTGKIGTDGTYTKTKCESAAARNELATQLTEDILAQGYVLSHPLFGVNKVVKYSAELDAQIKTDPNDKAPYLAYAKWFRKNGVEYMAKLIEIYHDNLAGMASWQDTPSEFNDYLTHENKIELAGEVEGDFHFAQWFMGIVQSVEYPEETSFGPKLEALLGTPIFHFIRSINMNAWLEYENGINDIAKAILNHGELPFLEQLILSCSSANSDSEDEYYPLGDLSSLWDLLPSLKSLHLRGLSFDQYDVDDVMYDGNTVLGNIKTEQLHSFSRSSLDFSRNELDFILQAKWPELVNLKLTMSHSAELTADDLAPLFDKDRFPKLETLAISSCNCFDQLLPKIVNSELISQLTKLEFSYGEFKEAGIQCLIDNKEKFSQVKIISLGSQDMTNETEELLKEHLTNNEVRCFGEDETIDPGLAEDNEDLDFEKYSDWFSDIFKKDDD